MILKVYICEYLLTTFVSSKERWEEVKHDIVNTANAFVIYVIKNKKNTKEGDQQETWTEYWVTKDKHQWLITTTRKRHSEKNLLQYDALWFQNNQTGAVDTQ